MYARDCYIRRSEGVSIWVVESTNITASAESDVENFVDPMDDKPYRHATHYVLPDKVNNM
jgi:ring-1,2-phenylacetyl-CoA epoxidase subunit PaaB